MEFTLLWAAATGGLALWVGVRLWVDELPEHPMDRLLSASLVGLVTGRLVAMLAQGVNPVSHPFEFLLIRGGVSTPAAGVGAIGWLAWTTRRRPRAVDALAPAAVLGLAGWHAGCLWRGACLGTASDLPWAWSGPMSDVTRHPVELYAAIALIGVAVLVGRLPFKPLLRSGSALALTASVRLLTDPMRPSIAGGPLGWYAAAIVVGIAAALLGDRLIRQAGTAEPT